MALVILVLILMQNFLEFAYCQPCVSRSDCNSGMICCNSGCTYNGNLCCNNNPCWGTSCCGSNCCSGNSSCCDVDVCCDIQNICCNRQCCYGANLCCGGQCCWQNKCCGNACCGGICCNGMCCEGGTICCNAGCCYGTGCNADGTCAYSNVGQSCLGSNCTEKMCCSVDGCCDGNMCCGGKCCRNATMCCGNDCCFGVDCYNGTICLARSETFYNINPYLNNQNIMTTKRSDSTVEIRTMSTTWPVFIASPTHLLLLTTQTWTSVQSTLFSSETANLQESTDVNSDVQSLAYEEHNTLSSDNYFSSTQTQDLSSTKQSSAYIDRSNSDNTFVSSNVQDTTRLSSTGTTNQVSTVTSAYLEYNTLSSDNYFSDIEMQQTSKSETIKNVITEDSKLTSTQMSSSTVTKQGISETAGSTTEEICTMQWSDYGPCSQTCGTGIMTRKRLFTNSSSLKCDIELNSKTCEKLKCIPMSQVEQIVANTVHTLGCTWVLGVIGVTIVVLGILKVFNLERVLHFGQEVSLFCAHVLIMFFVQSQSVEKRFCIWVSITLQYFFTVHFLFITLEALHNYSLITNAVDQGGLLSAKVNLLIGTIAPLAPTFLTIAFAYNHYWSDFSCWINFGPVSSAGILVPVFACFSISIVTIEATGQWETVPGITDYQQVLSAKINQRAMLFILPLSFLAWFVGSFAIYYQRISLYCFVFALNISLGISMMVCHLLGNSETRSFLSKLLKCCCKRKNEN